MSTGALRGEDHQGAGQFLLGRGWREARSRRTRLPWKPWRGLRHPPDHRRPRNQPPRPCRSPV